ncbi:MAG TPA: sugar phosphate isomerase/epimerase [Planctomycetaceae bacterium]|nr:sugar phosphate isomerase/epimerase [Planctomycetaceae bacterium]
MAYSGRDEKASGAEQPLVGAQQESAEASTSRGPQRLLISMNQTTTRRWTLQQDVLYYQEMEIDAIGVWRPKLAALGEDEAIEFLRDSGMKVTSVSWAGGFTGTNGYTFQEVLDDARHAIQTAERLKADCVVIISGPRNSHIKSHMYCLLVEALRELADCAAAAGVMLALKPMHRRYARDWTFVNTLDQTLDVLGRVAHPAVGIALNTHHLWQEPGLLDRIPEIVPLLATVQLSDWRERPTSDNDHCLLGAGQAPLPEIIHALLQNGYDGYFDVEIWSERLWSTSYFELIRACLSYLRTLPVDSRRQVTV